MQTRMGYKHICVDVVPEKQDVVIALLTDKGITGCVQRDDGIEFYELSNHWSRARGEELASIIRPYARRTSGQALFRVSPVPAQNWNAEWERSIKVLRPTRRIIIRPSWKQVRGSVRGKIVLTIDPKMSFGTGHHETTRLCLRLLEDHVKKGSTVLDFGTGTGILAIAAIKLGARRAIGIDNDPWCIENAAENVGRNRVEKRVRILRGGVGGFSRSTFDLIVANIDLPTITKVLPTLLRASKLNGTIILSGLMLSDLAATMRLFMKYHVEPELMMDEGEWMGLIAKKGKNLIPRRNKGRTM